MSMASDHCQFDHPYAIIRNETTSTSSLVHTQIETIESENTGITGNFVLFKGSPRKVLVEGIQGASLNVLHSIANNDDFLTDIGTGDIMTDLNDTVSEATLSGDDMEMEGTKDQILEKVDGDEVDGSGGISGEDDQDIEEIQIEKTNFENSASNKEDSASVDLAGKELDSNTGLNSSKNHETSVDKTHIQSTIHTNDNNSTNTDEQKDEAVTTETTNETEGKDECEEMESSINEYEVESDDGDEDKVNGEGMSDLTVTLIRRKGRPKKRRRSSGRGWTSKRLRRGLSGGSPRKAQFLPDDSSEKETNLNGSEEIDISNVGEKERNTEKSDLNKAEGSSQTDSGETPVTEERMKRRSRTPVAQNEYVIGDEALLDEVTKNEDSFYKKKKRGLLFDKGRKANVSSVAPLTPQEAEKFMEPFKHGWTREVVIRGVYDEVTCHGTPKSRPCDVYYHPPTGSKIRSMVQISEWLSKHDTPLSGTNFTFMRKAIGMGEGEVVRHAAMSRGRASSDVHKRKKITKRSDEHVHDDDNPLYDAPEVVIERDSDDFLMPIIAAGIASPVETSPVTIGTPPKLGRPPKQIVEKQPILPPPSEIKSEKFEKIHPSKEQVIVSPSKKKFKATARKSTSQKTFRKLYITRGRPQNKSALNHHPFASNWQTFSQIFVSKLYSNVDLSSERPIPYTGIENLCSLTCPGLEGMAPMLHCNMCMCLFHNECVNFYGSDGDFICLRCKGMNSNPMDSVVNSQSATTVMTVSTPVQLAELNKSVSPMAIQLVKGTTASMVLNSRSSPGMSPTPQMIRVAMPTSFQSTTPLYKSLVYENINSASPGNSERVLAYTPNSPSPVTLKFGQKSKSPYQEIRPNIKPTVKVKQEPVDDTFDTAKGEHVQKGGQASTQALGTLKNVLASRLTGSPMSRPAGSILVNQLNQPALSNSNSTSMTMSPLTFSLPSTSSLLNNSINALSRLSSNPMNNNSPASNLPQSRYNLVPIGPPVPLPNVPFQQVQIPGTQMHGLIPLSNIRAPLHSGLSNNTIKTSGTAIIPEFSKNIVTASYSQPLTSISVSSKSSSSSITTKQTDTQNHSSTGPVVLNANSVGAPMNGQLLTLPPAVVKRLTLNKPLALKINNRQINIPPSGFFHSPDGLKVFLPPNTFPTADEDINVSVMDDKGQDVACSKSDGNLPNLSNLDRSVNADSLDKNFNKTTDQEKNVIDVDSRASDNLNKTAVECKTTEKSDKTALEKNSSAETTDNLIENKSVVKTPDKGESVVSKHTVDIRKSKRYKKCCLIQRLYGGFDCMYCIFQYLNIKDLLSTSMVCKTWRLIAMHSSLWHHVSFSRMKVSDWQKAMKFLHKRQVDSISLIGLTHYEDPNRTWHQLVSSLQAQPTLTKISFGLVPASVLHSLSGRLTSVEAFCAECISDFNNESMWSVPAKLDIGKFSCLTALKELRLKGVCGLFVPSFSFSGGLSELSLLTNLQVLSITSLKNVTASDFNFISSMTNLTELSLGDCKSWTSETYSHLGKMTWLTKLRLEEGGEIPDNGLGEALANLTQLKTLELYTFTISNNLGDHLRKLPTLGTLVIWPDNNNSPAVVNSNTLTTVQQLTTLQKLDWVIPNSSSTSIILDDNDNTESVEAEGENQQWIPFLAENQSVDEDMRKKQVMEYIGVRQLTEKITKLLPETRIKVYCIKSDQD